MIIVQLGGGLGNQLYQYAFGRFLALKHNTELKLDINHLKKSSTTKEILNRYRLGAFNIIENFADEKEVKDIIDGKNKNFQVVYPGFGGGGGNRNILTCPTTFI